MVTTFPSSLVLSNSSTRDKTSSTGWRSKSKTSLIIDGATTRTGVFLLMLTKHFLISFQLRSLEEFTLSSCLKDSWTISKGSSQLETNQLDRKTVFTHGATLSSRTSWLKSCKNWNRWCMLQNNFCFKSLMMSMKSSLSRRENMISATRLIRRNISSWDLVERLWLEHLM